MLEGDPESVPCPPGPVSTEVVTSQDLLAQRPLRSAFALLFQRHARALPQSAPGAFPAPCCRRFLSTRRLSSTIARALPQHQALFQHRVAYPAPLRGRFLSTIRFSSTVSQALSQHQALIQHHCAGAFSAPGAFPAPCCRRFLARCSSATKHLCRTLCLGAVAAPAWRPSCCSAISIASLQRLLASKCQNSVFIFPTPANGALDTLPRAKRKHEGVFKRSPYFAVRPPCPHTVLSWAARPARHCLAQ